MAKRENSRRIFDPKEKVILWKKSKIIKGHSCRDVLLLFYRLGWFFWKKRCTNVNKLSGYANKITRFINISIICQILKKPFRDYQPN